MMDPKFPTENMSRREACNIVEDHLRVVEASYAKEKLRATRYHEKYIRAMMGSIVALLATIASMVVIFVTFTYYAGVEAELRLKVQEAEQRELEVRRACMSPTPTSPSP